ncbi:MAG: alpha/beta hydrolase [Burkholderiales bacterium]|nr:alpha/beta hydrolase [Burkholderiales bacterium]
MPGLSAARLFPAVLILGALLPFGAGCTRQPPVTGVTPIKAANPGALWQYLLGRDPDVELFRLRGPFRVTGQDDVPIEAAPGTTASADFFFCAAGERLPLVVLLHGHANSKDDHVFQALHLASWGMHAMTVQLPNRGPWIGNGRTLARVIESVHRTPALAGGTFDPDRIILVGHSFGATAVAAALAEGAPAMAAVLLDPAGIGRRLPSLLARVRVPVMVIGADEEIWPTRNRDYFFRFIPRGVAEISIRDAIHEDAQYPTERASPPGDGPIATEESQITFVSALTAAALSLSATGGLDYAWSSFRAALESGRFFNARRK